MKNLFFTLFIMSLTFPCIAWANGVAAVGGAGVTKGALQTELRIGYSTDDDRVSQVHDERLLTRVHVDYGVTDFYAVRFIVLGDDRKNNNLEHDSITLENRFELLTHKEHGINAGIRLGYTMKDGDKKPDNISLRLVETVPYKGWDFRFNQIFKHDVGEDSQDVVSFESRAQITYGFTDTVRAGLDSFNNLGNLGNLSGFQEQSHTIGPVLRLKAAKNTSISTGYTLGVSDAAPDHSWKLQIGQSF